MNGGNDRGGGRPLAMALAAIVVVAGALVAWFVVSPAGGRAGVAATRPTTGPTTEPAAAAASAVVYEAKLADLDPEWSAGGIATTKDGLAKFIGPFREGEVEFTAGHLPAHQFVRVTFDLMVCDLWNGDQSYFGRDGWDVRVKGGQPLVHTTFSNMGFYYNNNDQSYPDQFPWYPVHPAFAGAAERQSHGYQTGNNGNHFGVDATYRFDLTFPHAADELTLLFNSAPVRHEGKTYGFLSFQVTAVGRATTPDAATLEQLWDALGDEDAAKANAAVWSLVAAGDTATAHVRAKLAVPATQPVVMTTDAGDAGNAGDAENGGDAGGPPKMPGMRVVRAVNVDPDVPWVVDCFAYRTAGQRQRARAVHVLEAIGTPDATAVLRGVRYSGTPLAFPPDTSGFTQATERRRQRQRK